LPQIIPDTTVIVDTYLEMLQGFQIRPVIPPDAATWQSLRCNLWPDGAQDHGFEIARFFAGQLSEPLAVLLAIQGGNDLIGFVEPSTRSDVPSLKGKRTGFIEGLYVVPEMRFTGAARALLRAVREWANSMKCAAFASDRSGQFIVDGHFAEP
jgi:aminoglycoside 6'-N-acetyltransferase I